MITRREFLKYTGMAGVGAVIPGAFKVAAMQGIAKLGASPVLPKYVDALPIPPVKQASGTFNGLPLYVVTMKPMTQKVHRDVPATHFWGYDGMTPGPTFECNTGEPVYVRWVNNLPTTHLLASAIDHTLPGMAGLPDVRTTVHVHGAEVPFASDGVFTSNGGFSTLLPGQSATYLYTNVQHAATIWYHDHALGIDRLNVMAGMAGYFIIRDPVEKALNLPSGAFEIPIVIQDREVDAGAQLVYPTVGDNPTIHPQWVPEFFGDTAVVNGKVNPFLSVEPRKYRFRFLNGSNARFYNLAFTSGTPFFQIGTDGGLLPAPVEVVNLTFAPGERCDCVVDFAGLAGHNVVLKNFAPAPFPGGGAPSIPDIMQFKVNKPLSGPDTSSLPDTLRPVYDIPEGASLKVRNIVLIENEAPGGPLDMKLNGLGMMDPTTEKPELGAIEIWQMINTTADTHPMHVHLVQFRILDRRPFNVAAFVATGQIIYTGPPIPPDANERGWKDTARVNPGQITRYIIKFVSYVGTYVYHCHILEHEENDMMRPYETLPSVYYFAEGSCRPNFQPYLTLANPGDNQAGVVITYMLGNGTTKKQAVAVQPKARLTIDPKQTLGEGDDAAHDFSMKVECTNGQQVIAERPMYFNYKGKWTGGSCVVGALMPQPVWYFAEGNCRPNYDAYLTIQNPGNVSSGVKITYMLGNGKTKVQNLTVPAHTRSTVFVKDTLGEGDDNAHDFSAKVEVTSGSDIIAERPMYFNYKGMWPGGHCVVGAVGPAPTWYFAEGTTRPNFDSFLCIQNPGQLGAVVQVKYMRGDGTTKVQNLDVAAHSRSTIVVRDILGTADNSSSDFSAVVSCTNGQNLVVERSMYFNYKGKWTGGSCVMGSVLPDKAWHFAEGSARPNFEPYFTVLNPDPKNDAAVQITYLLANGASKVQTLTVPKASRGTVIVTDFLGTADDTAHDFAATVETTNGVEIVVERPQYFNFKGNIPGGHCTMGFSY
ncbi:MAG TPA: multicopper oxidase [Candidatus Anoxymicrobiaceae bacterium]